MGGLPTHLFGLDNLTSSTSYYQDDLTWCIQRAKFLPLYFNYFYITDTIVWLIIVILLLTLATVFYLWTQFDLKYKYRNHHDWFSLCFAVLGAYLGISPRFKPMHTVPRVLYALLLLLSVLVVSLVGFYLLNFMKVPIPYQQMKSLDEIIDADYRFMGSLDVLNAIKHNQKVIFFKYTQNFIMNMFVLIFQNR